MRVKPLVLFNTTGLALLISLLWPTLTLWSDLDERLIEWLLSGQTYFIRFAAVIDNALFDLLAFVIMLSLLVIAKQQDPAANALRRWLGISFAMLLVAGGLCVFTYSGLQIYHPAVADEFDYSHYFTDLVSLPEADQSTAYLVSNHGLILMVFAAFMWRFAEKKVALLSLLFALVFNAPRIVVGAHGVSGAYLTPLAMVLIILPWLLYTPFVGRLLSPFRQPPGGFNNLIFGTEQAIATDLAPEPFPQKGQNWWVRDGLHWLFSDLETLFKLEGTRITSDKKSDLIYRREMSHGYFIKRYWTAGGHFQNWLGVPRVQKEWENLDYFRAQKVPSLELIAYGSKRRRGRFIRGALVTKELADSKDLMQLVLENNPCLRDPQWVTPVSQQIADNLAHLHGQGFCHGDLFWRNLLVTSGPKPRVHFFDSPAGRFWWGPFLTYRRIKDLACLDKVARRQLSRSQRLRFFLRYKQQETLTLESKRQISKIIAYNNRK